MSSAAQVLANRANAKLSTGPKTEAGKQNSSKNATLHGFYSKAFIVADAEREDFNLLRGQLHGEYRPIDAVSEDFFQQILHSSWNLHRLRGMENETYATTADPFSDPAIVAKLDAIRRHKGHFERALLSARKQFSAHITAHVNLSAVPPSIRGALSPAVDVRTFNQAQIEKWKLYEPEDFVSPKPSATKQQKDDLWQAAVRKQLRQTASRKLAA